MSFSKKMNFISRNKTHKIKIQMFWEILKQKYRLEMGLAYSSWSSISIKEKGLMQAEIVFLSLSLRSSCPGVILMPRCSYSSEEVLGGILLFSFSQ